MQRISIKNLSPCFWLKEYQRHFYKLWIRMNVNFDATFLDGNLAMSINPLTKQHNC